MRHAPCRLFVLSLVLASFANFASADPATVSRLGWVLNGHAQAAVQHGSTLYAGGAFTRVAPTSGALGALFGVSLTTGAPTSTLPLVDGVVHAIEPDGAGGYYIGGAFATVGGVPRTNLAHVLADGSVDPAFASSDVDHVVALVRGSSFLFAVRVSGTFGAVLPTGYFVALNPATGARITTPAFPPVNVQGILLSGSHVILVGGAVTAIDQTTAAQAWQTTNVGLSIYDAVLTPGRLILGGRGLGGGTRLLASLDPATGAIDASWAPATVPSVSAPDVVESLAVSGTTLYVGGSFATFGGQARVNAAAVDIATATVTTWAPTVDASVSALAISPGGTVLLGGNFAHVNGDAREDFAEVDAGGLLLPWTANAYTAGVRTLRLDGDTLVVGSQLGVTGGEARTNLAAFDLDANTLLPWAPAMNDDVTALAVSGSSVFVGSARIVQQPAPGTLGLVSAVHAITGAPDVRPLPAPPTYVTLLGAEGDNVYLSLPAASNGTLVRFNAATNAIDPSWRPQVGPVVTRMAISNGIAYLANGNRLAAVDIRTGTVSEWNPPLNNPTTPLETATVVDVGVDGRTVYAAVRISSASNHRMVLAAFDATSASPVARPPGSVAGPTGAVGAIAIADGQLIAGADSNVFGFFGGSTRGLTAYAADGSQSAWNPGYFLSERPVLMHKSVGLLVTPTDIVALGYNAASPTPMQGIAVLARTPAVAPTSLTADVRDNLVTLQWNQATPIPASYQIEAGTESGAANILVHVPGTPANTLVASAGNGTYFVRVRNANAAPGASAPTNEIALIIGCTAAPEPPFALSANVTGANVALNWSAAPFSSPSSYVLEAGLTPGAADLSYPVPAPTTSFGAIAPALKFYVRVRARNACGLSEPSGEIFFTPGGATPLPPPVQGVSATVATPNVLLQWTAQPDALGYVLEAGGAPGRTDLTFPTAASSLAVGGVPRGVYYVRVRAVNGAGLGAPSQELIVIVQ